MSIATRLIVFFVLFLNLTLSISCAQKSIGIFSSAVDVGPVNHKGKTSYDKNLDTYELSGAGANIWFKKDEFHYAYQKLSGDFVLKANAKLIGEGVDAHRKLGWMVRSSMDTSAAMICATVHGDGLTAIQFRKKNGEDIEEVKSTIVMPDVIHLERRGRSFFMSIAKQGEPFWTVEIPDLDFPDEMFAGLFVCSHNADVVEKAAFWNVEMKGDKAMVAEP